MVESRLARILFSLFFACTTMIPALAAAGQKSDPQTPFIGTEWKLVALAGLPIAQDGSQARLQFAAEVSDQSDHLSGAINASDGCNTLSGSFQKDGSFLHMNVGPFTALACASPQRLVTRGGVPSKPGLSFGDALRRTSRVEIHGTTLVLKDRSGVILAGFLNR